MIWKHRYSVLVILLLIYLICYVDRMVMATAIPFIADDLQLSSLYMGMVLSAFFAGYAVMQIPGGILADRFGSRIVLTVSIVWWSLLTALTGMASGLGVLLATRVFFGLGEGPAPPSIQKAVAIWSPLKELARANGLLLAATSIGASIAPIFVTALIANWGWRSGFYFLCAPGLALAFLTWRYVKNSPSESAHVSEAELKEFDKVAEGQIDHKAAFLQSLRTPAVLWCAAAFFLSNLVNWGMLNWIPTYLLKARGFGVEEMGFFAAITNIAGAGGYALGGFLCDRYFRNNMRVPVAFGLAFGSVATYLAAIAPNGEMAVFWLSAALIICGIGFVPLLTVPMIAVPKHAVGGAFGIVNTVGQISGILAPLLGGYVLEVTDNNYQDMFYCLIALGLLAIGPAMMIRYGGDDR